VWLAIGLTGSLAAEKPDPAEEYAKHIRPILEEHCYKCHGPQKMKGGLNLSTVSDYQKVLEDKDVWQLVLERIQAYEMPPPGQPDLDFGKHERLLAWLRELPRPDRADCDQIASDRTANFYRGYVMSRRLNRAEYHNTLRDIFGVELQVDDLLPADGGGGEGSDTAGNALFVSSIHIEKYLAAADQALAAVLPEKSSPLPPPLAAARARILISRPTLFTSGHMAAEKVVGTFARRAFRRPVTHDELARLMTLFDRAYNRGDGYVPSVRQSLKAVLVSPNFLFLAEEEPSEGGVQRLAALPLASKLSYFLWSSMPDEQLLSLAESGQLLQSNVYQLQVRRMLADPKATALGERFALQWLNIDRLGSDVRPDPKKFPEFDAELGASMQQEAAAFFNHLVKEDRSLLELIDCDYAFVNERLARLYGIEGVSGPICRQVELTDRNRGGVLGLAAVHTLTSYPMRTSPVLRGKWLMETLLGEKVKPPPPDVPALEENPAKVAHITMRAQLEAHRSKPECAACHDKMDPLGFGLENFDVLGRWRDTDRGQPIDAQGKLSSGATFTGPQGLKKILMARKDDVIRVLVRKMIGFAFGRELNKFDDCVVDKTMKALKENDYRTSVLIEQIAASYPFQHRFYPKEGLVSEAGSE
jgi:hypothetical protein